MASDQMHDNFFVSSMSNLRVVKEVFAQNLPKNLIEVLDLSKTQICKDKFVTSGLKSKITDMIYQVQLLY